MQNRGVAVGAGKVLFGTSDNYLVALDQKTGREAWKSQRGRSETVRMQHRCRAAIREGQGYRRRQRRGSGASWLSHGL